MKFVGLCFLVVLSLCTCTSDKTVSHEDYNGEYPYIKSTGKPISTYQPVFTSAWQGPPVTNTPTPVLAMGEYAFTFKGHNWNHWPYTNISQRIIENPSSPFDRIGSRILGIGFTAMDGFECQMESVHFIVPAQVGRFRFEPSVYDLSIMPTFRTYDCDAPKDRITLDLKADNWVNITRLDTQAHHVEGSFNLNFMIIDKDVSYSLIYPTQIFMQGNFKGPYTN
ncbi:hypothetical protein [Fibrisoma limi]|uniref:hypothetical protein n=1 Tax=Fibrisoma limi TaxID=663275 RepID=UPI001181AF7C|nr:hypothetical protein [Fibrisoma limi]